MVNISATATLVAATAVFIIWRLLTWRRHGVRPERELVVVALFLWCLALVSITFFPMRIVLYDWYGSANLVPFASIVQLMTETPLQVATRNIAGNVILFMPFGFLLALLYPTVRSIGAVAWRAGVVSIVIELLQVVTRSRATDVDDVILNTLGAVIGFAIFWLSERLLGRRGAVLLGRIGAAGRREPLLDARWPAGITLILTVPLVAFPFVQSTVADGSEGILADAISRSEGGHVVHRGQVENHTYVLVERDGMIAIVEYEEVFPGRFTWVGGAAPISSRGSTYSWLIPAINPSVGEEPLVVVFGRNDVGAETVRVTGNGIDVPLALPDVRYFVVGTQFPFDSDAPVIEDFEFKFFDSGGASLTGVFTPAR